MLSLRQRLHVIIKKQTNKQKQKINTIQKERNLQMWNQSTGHDMPKKLFKHPASDSPNVMLCPEFEARLNLRGVHVSVVTSVLSFSIKKVTSFFFLLPFAVVTPILG